MLPEKEFLNAYDLEHEQVCKVLRIRIMEGNVVLYTDKGKICVQPLLMSKYEMRVIRGYKIVEMKRQFRTVYGVYFTLINTENKHTHYIHVAEKECFFVYSYISKYHSN